MATLAELQAELETYKKAEMAVLVGGQETEFAGRKVTRATISRLQEKIADLEVRIALLSTPQHGNVVFGGRR